MKERIKNSVQQSKINGIKKIRVTELAMAFCITCNYKGLVSSVCEYTYISIKKKNPI